MFLGWHGMDKMDSQITAATSVAMGVVYFSILLDCVWVNMNHDEPFYPLRYSGAQYIINVRVLLKHLAVKLNSPKHSNHPEV